MPTWTVSEVSEVSNELLTAGEYPAVIKKATLGIVQSGKNQGADKIDLQFRVADKTTVRDSLVFSESMAWKLNQFVHASMLGRTGDAIELNDQNVLGVKMNVRISQKEIVKQDGTKAIINQVERFIRPAAVVSDVDMVF